MEHTKSSVKDRDSMPDIRRTLYGINNDASNWENFHLSILQQDEGYTVFVIVFLAQL